MRHLFEAREKNDCTKCKYSRRIPLSDQLTCKHPLAHLQSNVVTGAHGQPYWPVSFDPKLITSCPCRCFCELKAAAWARVGHRCLASLNQQVE